MAPPLQIFFVDPRGQLSHQDEINPGYDQRKNLEFWPVNFPFIRGAKKSSKLATRKLRRDQISIFAEASWSSSTYVPDAQNAVWYVFVSKKKKKIAKKPQNTFHFFSLDRDTCLCLQFKRGCLNPPFQMAPCPYHPRSFRTRGAYVLTLEQSGLTA